MPDQAMSKEDLVNRLTQIQYNIKVAMEASGDAMRDAEALYFDLNKPGVAPRLVRFDHEVMSNVRDIARDLGAEVDGLGGDFDLERTSRDCLDLLDLIEFAAKPRETPVTVPEAVEDHADAILKALQRMRETESEAFDLVYAFKDREELAHMRFSPAIMHTADTLWAEIKDAMTQTSDATGRFVEQSGGQLVQLVNLAQLEAALAIEEEA